MTDSVTGGFQFSASYAPARWGLYWLENFSWESIRLDFDAAQQLGLRRLSLDIRWSDLQPAARRIFLPAMRSIEQVLDGAADRDLLLLPVLFPMEVAGMAMAPDWVLEPGGEPGRLVLAGNVLTHRPLRDIMSDEDMVRAQVRAVSEMTGAFAGHPALAGWVLGSHIFDVSPPSSATAFGQWLSRLVDAVSMRSFTSLWHGVSARTVVLANTFDTSVLSDLGVGLRVAADWHPAWAAGSGRWWLAFLAAYARQLTGAPSVINDAGTCTVRYDVPGTHGCVDETAAANWLEDVLPFLHEAGGGGCETHFIDLDVELRRAPPYDRQPGALSRGLLRVDRTPKPQALAGAQFALQNAQVRPLPDNFPGVDPDLRLRSPESVARDSFEAWTL